MKKHFKILLVLLLSVSGLFSQPRLSLCGAGLQTFSTDTLPSDLGSLSAWYDASIGITLNGATVSQWNDQSGYNRHLIQASASLQPTFTSNAINTTLPALYFDGSNDEMGLSASVTGFDSMTYFVVYKRVTNGSQAILSNGASTYMYLQYGNSHYIGNNSLSSPMTNNIWYVRCGKAKKDGNGTYHYSNGSYVGNVAGGTNVFDAFRYVGTAGGANMYGYVAEIIIFKDDLSAPYMSAMFSYLNAKYAVY